MFLSLKALPSGSGIDPGPTRLPLTIYRSQTPDRDAPDSSKEKWKNRITPPERILGREIRARRECMFTSVKQLLEWSHFSFHVPLKHLTDVERRGRQKVNKVKSCRNSYRRGVRLERARCEALLEFCLARRNVRGKRGINEDARNAEKRCFFFLLFLSEQNCGWVFSVCWSLFSPLGLLAQT